MSEENVTENTASASPVEQAEQSVVGKPVAGLSAEESAQAGSQEPVAGELQASAQPVAGSQQPVAIPETPPTTGSTSTDVPLTAQAHGNEPFSQKSEPFDSTHDKPLVKPEETPSHEKESPRARSIKGNARKRERKREKIGKLMAEIEKRGKISNNEVEKLLRVSDATATRYLSVLEKDGKIKQVGKTGRGVVYTKV